MAQGVMGFSGSAGREGMGDLGKQKGRYVQLNQKRVDWEVSGGGLGRHWVVCFWKGICAEEGAGRQGKGGEITEQRLQLR